jgi:para-aminobenzoate synthetase component I
MLNTRAENKSAAPPTICEIPFPANDLIRALLSLPSHLRLSLLDSCGARPPAARFLIAGFGPVEVIEVHGRRIRLTSRDGAVEYRESDNALGLLDQRLAKYRLDCQLPEYIPAAGACIATFSYDLVNSLERLRIDAAPRSTDEPDLVLAFYDTLLIHDYQSGITRVVCLEGSRGVTETVEVLSEALRLRRADFSAKVPSILDLESNLTRDEYLSKVRKIKEHIAEGDIYQANLTQQFSCVLSAESRPEDVFLRLRRDHPASFAAFIRRREDVVISASPERFLRVTKEAGGRLVEAWPIKGTRPRGESVEEDESLRLELLSSEKDRAENIMIVDLLRNDLGRVCRYGSIEVAKLCALEEHPTLFHLVSQIRGTLRDEITASALLRATFPCGSITGAPKIRAMEIIAETETAPRGLSMGALGYFSFNGSLDLNVAIRTMVLRNRVARFNVGGGIVSDSSPPLEYEESLVKARALFSALGAGDERSRWPGAER